METGEMERSRKRRVRKHSGVGLPLVVSRESTPSPNQEDTGDPPVCDLGKQSQLYRIQVGEDSLWEGGRERSVFCRACPASF